MRVVLVRHGEASDPRLSSDASRHLTLRGREVSAQVARALAARGIAPTVIYTSPLVRAVQTAEIFASTMAHPGPIRVHDHLVPGATTARALSVLDDQPQGAVVLLVTHEPTVHTIAGHLTGLGGAFPGFRTSGAAIIDLDEEGGGRLIGRFDPTRMRWREPGDLAP